MEHIFLKTEQAAKCLGIAKSDLDRARVDGTLSGVEPPPFVRIGKRVRYPATDLKIWANRFKRQTTVAEETAKSH